MRAEGHRCLRRLPVSLEPAVRLVQYRRVDDVRGELSGECRHDVAGGATLQVGDGLLGIIRHMRGHDYLRHTHEGMARRRGFGGQHVEGGTGDPVLAGGSAYRLFVDQSAATRVDQVSGRLHKPEGGFVDHPARLRGSRGMKGDIIRLPQQFFEALGTAYP